MLGRSSGELGHTLPELIATLGILSILAVAAVPTFSTLLLESRMNAAVMTAMHAVHLARQYSASRGETIQLCGSDDTLACSGRKDWSAMLLRAEAGGFLRSLALVDQTPLLHSNRAIVQFEGGSGFASPATLTFCDRRGPRGARAVIISRSGRPRVSTHDASDSELAC